MRLRWGGLEQQAIGVVGPPRRAGAPPPRHLDHQPRDPRDRLALAGRPRAGVARPRHAPDEPEIHVVLSVRDLTRQIPAEWQENVKHRRGFRYSRFLDLIQDPDRADAGSPRGSGASRRSPRSSTAGPTTCRPSASTSSPCRRRAARPRCCGSASRRPSASTASTSTSRPAAATPRSACPRSRCCAASTTRSTSGSRPSTTAPWSASCSPTRPSRSAAARRGSACRPTLQPVGRRPRALLGRRDRPQRGYDVIGDVAELVGSPPFDGTPAEEAAGPPGPTPTGPASGPSPAPASPRSPALLVDNARMREEEERLRDELARDPAGPRAGLPAPDLPRAREGRAPPGVARPAAGP